MSALEDAAVSHAASDARRAAEIEYLKVTIAKLKKLAFGRKSEKYDAQLEQLELQLDERIADEAASPAGMRGETAHTRKPATRNRKRPVRTVLDGFECVAALAIERR